MDSLVKKIKYYCTFPAKFLRILKQLAIKMYLNNGSIDPYNDLVCRRIFRRHKLEIILDNPYSPEEGRDLLNIFFSIKNNFSRDEHNLVIARNSSLNGYLWPIVKYLNLKPVVLSRNFNYLLKILVKTPAIYVLDPGFSPFLFRDISYLTRLRICCQDELIIAVKIHISNKEVECNPVENFIRKNYSKAFYTEKDEIYYADSYIRWLLHDCGFFEVLGPFTVFPGKQYIKSRLVEDEGRYTIVSAKKNHPVFKGLALYRAATKTFVNYLEKV